MKRQVKACENYAREKGYEVGLVVREYGSGLQMPRSGIIEVLNYCKKNYGSIIAMIVKDIERISRQPAQVHYVLNTLAEMGVSIKLIKGADIRRIMRNLRLWKP